jgi:sulfate-transporting ATPase
LGLTRSDGHPEYGAFLDRIATHVLAFEGDSEVRWFEGNFSDYEADWHRRLGTDADQPHRLRYKPLVRD